MHRSHNTTKQKFRQNHSPVNVEIRGNFYSRRLIDLPNQKNNTCYFGQCGLIMQKMLGMLGTFCRNCAWMMPYHLTFNFIVLKIFASNKMKKLKNTYRRAELSLKLPFDFDSLISRKKNKKKENKHKGNKLRHYFSKSALFLSMLGNHLVDGARLAT